MLFAATHSGWASKGWAEQAVILQRKSGDYITEYDGNAHTPEIDGLLIENNEHTPTPFGYKYCILVSLLNSILILLVHANVEYLGNDECRKQMRYRFPLECILPFIRIHFTWTAIMSAMNMRNK